MNASPKQIREGRTAPTDSTRQERRSSAARTEVFAERRGCFSILRVANPEKVVQDRDGVEPRSPVYVQSASVPTCARVRRQRRDADKNRSGARGKLWELLARTSPEEGRPPGEM